jgi:GT2 family glycosyltransferase
MGMDRQNGNTSPRVSVVIVTYRSTRELPGCIDSLRKQSVPIEIFLVDNASPDATPHMVSDYAERFNNVHCILNRENVGLSAGNNCALGRCSGDYILILNPDTALPSDSLGRMIHFLDENPDIGVLGPKCVYEDGTPHVSFHGSWGILHILAWRVLPYRFVRKLFDRFSQYKFHDVLFVSGACLLIRRNLFEALGGYDPEYFLTVEDAMDLCIRAKATGERVVFFPDAQVYHYTGRSATQTPYLVVWEGIRGTVYHFLKHKGRLQALLISAILGLSAAARVAVAGVLGVANSHYRSVARIYAAVLRELFFRNPILVDRARGHRLEKTCSEGSSLTTRNTSHLTPRVVVVVLNWNNYGDTASLLSSLSQVSGGDNREIVVVDNGSTDGSVSQIRTTFCDVRVLETGRNLGFAGGCNIGIRYALSRGADFVWLLNNDTTIDSGAVVALLDKAQTTRRIGACGSAVYSVDDPQRLQAWGGGHINFLLGRSRHYLRAVPDESLQFITGASMLIRCEAIADVGLLDERFFMYWEDADFCFRLRGAGWKLAVAGDSRIWHKGSASVGKESARLDQYFNASARRFFRKHAPIPFLPIWMGSALRIGKRVLKGDWTRALAVVSPVAEQEVADRQSGGRQVTSLEEGQLDG